MITLQLCIKQAFLHIIHSAQTHLKKKTKHISHSNLHCKSQAQKNIATTQPIASVDAAALLSGSSPINLSTMLEAISSLQNHPPLACPTCSVKNQAMSTNESFPVLLAFSNKAFKSLSKLLRCSASVCCLTPHEAVPHTSWLQRSPHLSWQKKKPIPPHAWSHSWVFRPRSSPAPSCSADPWPPVFAAATFKE